MTDLDSPTMKVTQFAPGKIVPSNGTYLAHFVSGGTGGSDLRKGRKFPTKLLAHAVKYWTADRRDHPTDSNLDPGDRAPRKGMYRAHLVGGGTKDKRFAEREPLLPASFGGKKVRKWTFVPD